jgi:hypothetical protein
MRPVALAVFQLGLLATTIGAYFWVRERADGLFWVVVALTAAFPGVWLLVSALSPTNARRCPQCSAEALAAAADGTPGLERCSSCGYEHREPQ